VIGIYTRVSTDSQASEGMSLEIQKDKGIKFAKSLHEDYRVFEDAGISGGTFEREQFQALLSSIRKGELNKVWVISKDRLTRASLSEALSLRDFFIENKTKLFIDGNLHSLSSPEDLLQSNILDAIAEFQRLLIKKKTTEARQRQIDAGENTFSSIYGYNFRVLPDGMKQWYVDEEEAALVRYIFNLYFEDLNFDQICRRLSLEGYKTKLRGNWDRGTIHNILRRPEYIGMTRNTKDELVLSKYYPQIVEKGLWERVQGTIDGKIRVRQGKHFRAASYDLSGILKCASCGARYFFHSSPGRHGEPRTTYAHKMLTPIQTSCKQSPLYFNRTIADYLMRVLFERVYSDVNQIREYLKKVESETTKDTAAIDKDIRRVQTNIDELGKQRKRIIDAIKKGVLTDDDVGDEMASIREALSKQQNNIEELQKQKIMKQSDAISVIYDFADDLLVGFKDAKPVTRREYYLKYCTSITVEGYNLHVQYRTGKEERINIRDIPVPIMDDMIELYFQDKHPELEYFKSRIVDDIPRAMKPRVKEYNEGLARERDIIRQRFLLKTKGRPRKPKAV
jgi:site-specific DNA recombinase